MGVKQALAEAVGIKPKGVDHARFERMSHPRVPESAKARDDCAARIEAERKKLSEHESRATAAKAAVRSARLAVHEGVSKPEALEAAKRAAEEAADALEASRDLLEALQAKHARASEDARRAIEEGEQAAAEALREAVRQNVAKTRALVEGDGGMIALAEEREVLLKAAEKLSAHGSPGAARVGSIAGMGASGGDILRGRGNAAVGPWTINAAFLHDGNYGGGCAWEEFLESARLAAVIE